MSSHQLRKSLIRNEDRVRKVEITSEPLVKQVKLGFKMPSLVITILIVIFLAINIVNSIISNLKYKIYGWINISLFCINIFTNEILNDGVTLEQDYKQYFVDLIRNFVLELPILLFLLMKQVDNDSKTKFDSIEGAVELVLIAFMMAIIPNSNRVFFHSFKEIIVTGQKTVASEAQVDDKDFAIYNAKFRLRFALFMSLSNLSATVIYLSRHHHDNVFFLAFCLCNVFVSTNISFQVHKLSEETKEKDKPAFLADHEKFFKQHHIVLLINAIYLLSKVVEFVN